MTVRVRCPNVHCQQVAGVPDTVIGKSAKCRNCGMKFVLHPIDETTDRAAEISLSMLKDEPSPAADRHVLPLASDSAPRPPAPDPEAAPGTVIGRFEVRERIGSGAFGTVYLAFDPQLQREVALKVPQRSVLSNPRRIERFLREARAAAKLRHPNIVPVYDAGQAGDQHYIASAFVRGEPLNDSIDEDGIDLKRAAKIVRALAEGLAYAHQEGVVHRDVKPANVMVDDQDQPLLMDFGLAAQVDTVDEFSLPEHEADDHRSGRHDDSRLTREGSVMGTPSYMAPEIARGQRGEARAASDQYALGVVLYELLTGRTPFEGPPAAVLHQVIHEEPPKPGEFRKDLPPDLETICLKAMAKDPRDRYATCQSMADDLRRWMDGEPIRARRLGMVERTTRWIKREPKLALTSGGLGIALLVIAGLLAVLLTSAMADRDVAKATADRNARERDETEARRLAEQEVADRAAKQQKADADTTLAREKLDAGDANAAWGLLNGIPADFRNPAWPFLIAEVEGFPEFRRTIPAQPTAAINFDSGSRFLLQVATNGDLVVRDAWTLKEIRRLQLHRSEDQNFWHSAAISADGKRVATFASPENQPGFGGSYGGRLVMPKRGTKAPPRKPEIVVWDEKGEQIRAFPAIDAPLRLALSPDGVLLAVAGGLRDGEQKLTVWNVDTGERIATMDKSLSVVAGPAFAITFSPDGKLLAATTIQDGGEIRIWDTATGEERLVIKDRTAVITHLAFSPDGTRLAAAGGGDRLEGPEITAKVRRPETYSYMVNVERGGKQVSETRTATRLVEEDVKTRGYRNPRVKTVSKPVCMTEKRTKTLFKQVKKMEPYTVYETKTVKEKRNGMEEIVQKQVPVTKLRYVTMVIPETVEYSVQVTKMVTVQEAEVEPLVRVWSLEGGSLQTTMIASGPVTALAWRPDDALLATASERRDACSGTTDVCGGYGGYGPYSGPGLDSQADRAVISLWDPVTGKRLAVLPTSTAPVTLIALSADGNHIAAGSAAYGASLTIWSTSSRWLLANGRGDGPVVDLLFSQDSERLASYSQCNNTVYLWDNEARSLVKRLDGSGPFMQFLPSGRFMALRPAGSELDCGFIGHGYGGGVGPLGRWISRDGSVEAHPANRVGVLAYTEDGKHFVVRESTPTMRLVVHEGQTGAQVCVLAESFAAIAARKLQISRDGSRVAAVTWAEAFLWDGKTGELLARRVEAADAALSPDGNRWAVAMRPMYAQPPVEVPIPAPKKADTKEPPQVLPPQGPKVAAAVAGPGAFFFPKIVPEPQPKPLPAKKSNPGPGRPAPVSPKPPTLTIYDGNAKELAKLPGAEFFYSSLTFDPTAQSLVAVTSGEVVKIWDAESGKLKAQYRTNDTKIAISPDGRYLAFHRPQPLFPLAAPMPIEKRVADNPLLVQAEPAPQAPTGDVPDLEPSFMDMPDTPGGKRMMFIAVVDLGTGKPLWNGGLRGTGHGGMAFSADGKRLALGYVDGKFGYVQVWDTVTPPKGDGNVFKNQIVVRYSGHFGAVNSVAFSPDGTKLASGGHDRVVKVWKLPAEGETGPGADGPMFAAPRLAAAQRQ